MDQESHETPGKGFQPSTQADEQGEVDEVLHDEIPAETNDDTMREFEGDDLEEDSLFIPEDSKTSGNLESALDLSKNPIDSLDRDDTLDIPSSLFGGFPMQVPIQSPSEHTDGVKASVEAIDEDAKNPTTARNQTDDSDRVMQDVEEESQQDGTKAQSSQAHDLGKDHDLSAEPKDDSQEHSGSEYSDSDLEMENQATDTNLGASFLGPKGQKRKRSTTDNNIDYETIESINEEISHQFLNSKEKGTPAGASRMFTNSAIGSDSNTPSSTRVGNKNFDDVKNSYLAKKKEGKTTLEDDIAFNKAHLVELRNLRKAERELAFSQPEGDEMEDAESCQKEVGYPAGASVGRKTRKARCVSLISESEKIEQVSLNMQAGIPERLQKTLTRLAAETNGKSSKAKKSTGASNLDELMKAIRTSSKKAKKSTNLAGTSLFNAADKFQEKESLPAMVGKDKKKAMASLIASIPLEEEQKSRATADKASIHKATVTIENCSIKPDAKEGEAPWQLKGLCSTLHHFQVQGVARMKERENEASITAGILADTMGLGKTVQTIALMVCNPPPPRAAQKATLIVCSPAIINNWDHEIAKHKNRNVLPTVIRHYGATRLSDNGASGAHSFSMLENADIVLTTYSELSKSYPKFNVPATIADPNEQKHEWQKEWELSRGLLHRVHWYRVIIDEAQAIKNHTSHTSIACRALMGKLRWAISGTPIMNSLKEFYPYFKFLQIKHSGNYQSFRNNFCGPGKVHVERLHAFLDHMMIRRCHGDELMGRKLITLPKYTTNLIGLNLNLAEQVFYKIIDGRFRKAINKAKDEGEEARKRMIVARILRLQQCNNHMLGLQGYLERVFMSDDIKIIHRKIERAIEDSNDGSKEFMSAVKAMVEANDRDRLMNLEEPSGDGPTLTQRFRQKHSEIKESGDFEELSKFPLCRKCQEIPSEPIVTDCLHLYCANCLIHMASGDRTICIPCQKPFAKSERYSPSHKVINKISPDEDFWGDEAKNKIPRKAAADNMKWAVLNNKVLASTKAKAAVTQIKEWLAQFPKTKLVVFSRFHLLYVLLQHSSLSQAQGAVAFRSWNAYAQKMAGIVARLKYHGVMTHEAREKSLNAFRDDPDVPILISTLQAGGIGLNLTMAQRVIIADLWFNECMENQAFCRVYRIGQNEETEVVRLVVRDSIDMRLLEMQDRKMKEIAKAMDNTDVLMSMSLEKLMSLFGEVRTDEDGLTFIYEDEFPLLKDLPKRITEPGEND